MTEYIPGQLYKVTYKTYYIDDHNEQDQGCYETGSFLLCISSDENISAFLDPDGKKMEAKTKELISWLGKA